MIKKKILFWSPFILLLLLTAGCVRPVLTTSASPAHTPATVSTIQTTPSSSTFTAITATSTIPASPVPSGSDSYFIQIAAVSDFADNKTGYQSLNVEVICYDFNAHIIDLSGRNFSFDIALTNGNNSQTVYSNSVSGAQSTTIPFNDFMPYNTVDLFRGFDGWIKVVLKVASWEPIENQVPLQLYLNGMQPVSWNEYWDHFEAIRPPNRIIDGFDERPLFPARGANAISRFPSFTWGSIPRFTGYDFYLATDSNFTQIVDSGLNLQNNYYLIQSPLKAKTTYFWKVRTLQDEITSDWVTLSFTTR